MPSYMPSFLQKQMTAVYYLGCANQENYYQFDSEVAGEEDIEEIDRRIKREEGTLCREGLKARIVNKSLCLPPFKPHPESHR